MVNTEEIVIVRPRGVVSDYVANLGSSGSINRRISFAELASAAV